jgi:hypothetical protein
MEVNGQFYAPAALLSEEVPPVFTERKAGWTPEPVLPIQILKFITPYSHPSFTWLQNLALKNYKFERGKSGPKS